MKNSGPILQIVPRAPGAHDGVGDYALRLADRLHTDYGRETVFAAACSESNARSHAFNVVSLDSTNKEATLSDIILHYVNYGYQNRGVPFQLLPRLRHLRSRSHGRLITILHELYASSPPWQSAFWLQPLQKFLARRIAQLSDACIVSSGVMRDLLLQLAPQSSIFIHPTFSNLGEPTFSQDQFIGRDPGRWAIFGGTALIERSLPSLMASLDAIPSPFSPRDLFVLGGKESHDVCAQLRIVRDIECHYFPAIEASAASEILSSCAFGWIDYFRQPDVPIAAILKSGSFAAYCAHGVIPVLPNAGSAISIADDRLPGPYFVGGSHTNLPAASERGSVSEEIYKWYQRNASAEHLARGVAKLLGEP